MLSNKAAFLKWLYNSMLIMFLTCMVSCSPTHIASGKINPEILEPGNVKVPLGEEGRAEALIKEFGRDDLSSKAIMDLINYWAKKDLPCWDIDGAANFTPDSG